MPLSQTHILLESSHQGPKQTLAKGQPQHLPIDNSQLSPRLKWKTFHQKRPTTLPVFSCGPSGYPGLTQLGLAGIWLGSKLGDADQPWRSGLGGPAAFAIARVGCVGHKQGQGQALECKRGSRAFPPTVSSHRQFRIIHLHKLHLLSKICFFDSCKPTPWKNKENQMPGKGCQGKHM